MPYNVVPLPSVTRIEGQRLDGFRDPQHICDHFVNLRQDANGRLVWTHWLTGRIEVVGHAICDEPPIGESPVPDEESTEDADYG
jgi:hypothetical protein